jgi:predicted AlkP superfamily phosphohydrolase/phosphomutase
LVAPGAEYEAVCDEITAALLELEHAETGRPVVHEVIRPHELYKGDHVGVLPDLLVVWTSESPVTGVRSPRIGTIELGSPERRSGGHRSQGFFVASGHRIRRGVRLEGFHIMDLAPTMLHLLGVDVPVNYDGRVMPLLVDARR